MEAAAEALGLVGCDYTCVTYVLTFTSIDQMQTEGKGSSSSFVTRPTHHEDFYRLQSVGALKLVTSLISWQGLAVNRLHRDTMMY